MNLVLLHSPMLLYHLPLDEGNLIVCFFYFIFGVYKLLGILEVGWHGKKMCGTGIGNPA